MKNCTLYRNDTLVCGENKYNFPGMEREFYSVQKKMTQENFLRAHSLYIYA